MAWHNIKDYKRHKDMVFNQQCDCTYKPSRVKLYLKTLSKMSAPGKVNITYLCSKSIIQSDSLSIIIIFWIIYFWLYCIFILLLLWIVNSGWPKKKEPIDFLNIFFICSKGYTKCTKRRLINKRKEKLMIIFFCFSENCSKRRSYTSDKCRSTKRWWQRR